MRAAARQRRENVSRNRVNKERFQPCHPNGSSGSLLPPSSR
jgi:hypothetical protein